MPNEAIVYDIVNLTKRYPGQRTAANDDITLEIRQGEIFGILGDNGAGKSTLVRQMVNLLRCTAGSISLFGRNIARDPAVVTTHIGYTPQDTPALNNLSVGEALYFTAHLRGLSRAAAHAECERLLDLWQLRPLRHKYSSRMSGGETRLLRLAVAMAASPPVLILDEPTRDLDPLRRKLVWDVLRQTVHEQGVTVVLVTHDAIEAEKVIQRVAIMRAGRVVALGRPADLKQAVDRKIRLEIHLPLDAASPLPALYPCRELEPGHWLALLERPQLGAVLEALDLHHAADFRLYSATLEDLYLYYATQP